LGVWVKGKEGLWGMRTERVLESQFFSVNVKEKLKHSNKNE
jgi:hypothetical protein